MTVHIVKDQSNQSDRSARRARLAYRSRRRNAFESVGERLNETQRPAGYNYQDIDISGSANVHLGSVINSYTVQGGIQLTQSDVDSLTGPLNVSNAAQGLTLSATKFLVELGKEVYVQQRSELYIALEAFRTLLRRILPASLLSNLTQRRAALIPAVDLVATLTEAVLIFANIEESLSISLDESSGSKKEGLPSHVRLAQQLHAVNEILSMYNSVLSTESADDAVATSVAAHRASSTIAEHRRPSRPSSAESKGTLIRLECKADQRHQGPSATHHDARLNAWTRGFEIELLQSRVYNQSPDRDQTISSMTSSLGDAASTILPLLSLADVSIVSVLRLPVRLQTLFNSEAYTSTLCEGGRQPELPGQLVEASQLVVSMCCVVCAEESSEQDFSFRPMTSKCTHENLACRTCAQRWLQMQLDSTEWDQLTCIQCPERLTHDDLLHYGDAALVERYGELATRAMLSANNGFRWCKRPGCRAGQGSLGDEATPIFHCASCGYKYCVLHERAHDGESCSHLESYSYSEERLPSGDEGDLLVEPHNNHDTSIPGD